MRTDLVSMSAGTGIPIQTLEGILGQSAPGILPREMEAAINEANTLVELHKLIHTSPKGTPFLSQARKKHRELHEAAVEKAATVKEWAEIYRFGLGDKDSRAAARSQLDKLFEPAFAEARTVPQLLLLYRKFNIPGGSMRPFRQRIIRAIAPYYQLPE